MPVCSVLEDRLAGPAYLLVIRRSDLGRTTAARR